MNIIDVVIQRIKDEYKAGATQVEIAKRHNVPHSYIQRLLSGKRVGLTLNTLFKMFPNARLDLGEPAPASRSSSPSPPTPSVHARSIIDSQIGNGNTMHNRQDDGGDLRNRLKDMILNASGLSAEDQVRLMRLINEAKG